MATNIIDDTGSWDLKYTATGAITAGYLIGAGNFYGVAVESATGAGQVIAVKMECEARLLKKAAASTNMAVGSPVKVNTATGGILYVQVAAATGDAVIGYATAVAATGATTAKVRLIYPQVLRGDLFT